MTGDLAVVEARYRDARDLEDRRRIGVARGKPVMGLTERTAAAARSTAEAIAAVDPASLRDPEDVRALATMRTWAEGLTDENAGESVDGPEPPHESWAATAERGFDALVQRIETGYAVAQASVAIGDVTLTRLAVLERLRTEADPAIRRRLFAALEPVWQSIDGGGTPASSPYQRLLDLSARRWAAGQSPVDRNAAALGLPSTDVEALLEAILGAWRATVGEVRIQPQDWWYATGAASRALHAAAPLHRLPQIASGFHASLGANPVELGVQFDVFPRPGRPMVPVAYTDFGGRPGRHDNGTPVPAPAWIMATYTTGGLGELTELVHETGHAIHIAAIDTRPAFADWPDSDAFTEALAELTGMDTAEPAWQAHWLGASVPEAVSMRDRYADVMLDVCWALFEIRLHADPQRLPNELWSELTSTYLGIAPHPELSWWAMRGQLVQEPGYMVNYALGPIITADMRAAIRAARGDWSVGDPGWYGWVADRVYRWGLERSCGAVLTEVLGRPLSIDALLADIRRAGDRV